MDKPVIGITIGDPAGVGPEVTLKAFKNKKLFNICIPVVIGDINVIKKSATIVGYNSEINLIEGTDQCKEGKLNLLSLNNVDFDYRFGSIQPECGRVAFEYIKIGIELALAGNIDAVVTAPIHKEALNLAGFHYSGHTEIFADLTKAKDYAMMLASEPLKVIHVSTHVSLRNACDMVKQERVHKVIKLAYEGIKGLGVQAPRIAVAGLNPHAGETGLFGDEEIKEIIPAVERAKQEGFNVTGPLPPDTIFLHCKEGKYDIAVVMYHDQGHIPLKLLDFMGGVNITVGLPIIRTSVDHGTAFGKAGKGTADETSMIKAIETAVQFAINRQGD
ncbi:4-hydroxythreonine-4-phosphate dehydrogenase PdxA [Acetomicrobium hydrogeniformans]|jgi:4-hydroxythreonine-4-phosphate dehydrogenase|uniref:4-hydroxythreonine-4-phosphate dehydrogenase n=1 Tax=Acetomicrobium hydrogeniformans ATCC BAA-1850 TaxID=592015 RepID=A0A0T5X8L1_9BACT|nr:4-hydroxythreonine-4-phosphate dehydrogenase PdxA [Acetomicrobium hydrogeniformans]KRT34484.1 4-hydroxythreonine-4-phosphate dehydrogenase [Acetomicrobium hydrogeniformans ATCC BAA-1850]